MINEVLDEFREKSTGALQHLRSELAKIRTGRANTQILNDVRVEYYGSPTPLNQVATVKVPEPRLIIVQPWEKNMLAPVERAIMQSDLGLTPSNDGSIIRIPIPPLTGERRAELGKLARKYGEDGKISIRAARREANEMLKELEKEGEISEDQMHRGLASVQEATDKAVADVDRLVEEKIEEIAEV